MQSQNHPNLDHVLGGWRRRWRDMSLIAQFMTLTAIVVSVGMLMIGQWVTNRIANGVIHTSAAVSALYTDTFIEPNIQELKFQPTLSPASEKTLDGLLLPQVVGKPIIGFRIWKADTIVYSDRKELIGRSFPPSLNRTRAWAGAIEASFGHLDHSDHAAANMTTGPVLEIYAPVREVGTGRVLALAETYELATALEHDLHRAKVGSWLIVGMVTFAMLSLQYFVVHAGSMVIGNQRIALRRQILDLEKLLEENTALRFRANEANGRVAEMNDRYLREIAADIHDGPLQYLGIARLRLDSLMATVKQSHSAIVDDANTDYVPLRDALIDALKELRDISTGLSLPELRDLSLPAVLEAVVARHERLTGFKVESHVDELPLSIPPPVKGCLYRFVQEGLTNAYRHADGNGQTVEAMSVNDVVEVRVLDRGADSGHVVDLFMSGRQGLSGLRDRLEALGGTLDYSARPGGGTSLVARVPINLQSEGHHV